MTSNVKSVISLHIALMVEIEALLELFNPFIALNVKF